MDYNLELKIERMILSDGGEGVLEVFKHKSSYTEIKHESLDALRRKISTYFLWDEKRKRVLISLAEILGIERLSENDRNVLRTSSYGLGVSLLEAFRLSPMEIVLFLGGSATNDAGIGVAEALGYEFFDKQGEKLTMLQGKSLAEIETITMPEHRLFEKVKCILACDVQNVFFGETGAVKNYAKQKGADEPTIELLEKAMQAFHQLISKSFHRDINFPGAGAAGGMAGGLSFFINGEPVSAFNWISKEIDLEGRIKQTDVIITGEGKVDKQSFQGKLLGQLLEMGNRFQKEIYIICGIAENQDIYDFPTLFTLHDHKPEVINPALEYTLVKKMAKTIARSIAYEKN